MNLQIKPEIEEILQQAGGRRITEKEALKLMNSSGDELFAVAITADRLRKSKAGNVVTYVINRNINFTNVCVSDCEFCAFRRDKSDADAYLLTVEQAVEKSREAKKLGATEVCIQGGLHPSLDANYYSDIIKAIKRNVEIHVHAFSPMEISYAAEKSGMSIRKTLKYLKESGLDSMPGTAAEILDDGIRSTICPKKLKSREWIKIVEEAHRLGIPTTATMLYGHVESAEKKIKHLKILRDIQEKTSGFTEFVPLSFVHFNTPLYRSGKSKGGATGIEDIRVYAVSRIFLDNFRNIQASWVKLGRKLAQVMLNFGANDLGGTLMEENISRTAGSTVNMPDKKELERMIIEAGRIPRQRDTLYKNIY
ncbi:MAG: 5-amino-6-(D-ribitylamino)uracil--L-tyrosine 4-hydroxyphenyl transferase CofH [Candidatus Hydrothermarchaeota archaeon]|nr:5-amino-6-(D-ribitylamino)uracil--L-tyrosine 4-hydroxyphenyl transferase CofH [Candidatus Hydrothermarchaeota archaeon]